MNKPNYVMQYGVPIPNTPGTLGKFTQVLHKEGINISGIMIESVGDVSFVRFTVDKETGLKKLLEHAGYQVFETPVFCLELPNRPGELSRLAKYLGDEDINIRHIWGLADGDHRARIAVVLDQPEKARSLLVRYTEKLEKPEYAVR